MYIILVVAKVTDCFYGEIAQLARARGSYPRCRGFKSPSRYNTKMRESSYYLDFRYFFERVFSVTFCSFEDASVTF